MNISAFVKHKLMNRTPMNGCYGAFETFEAAEAAAPRGSALGYDAADTGGWYRDLMKDVHHDEYPMLYWFEKTLNDSRRIVEIGGHVGVAFYAFANKIAYPSDLRWTIVDVPSATRAGEELAKERGTAALLSFANELTTDLEPMDVLMASGSLQYVPGPLLPERIGAIEKKPRHIIIHKTPVIERKGYVSLQFIGASWCPYRIFGYNELVQPIIDLGYELVDTWAKERAIDIQGRPELKVTHYSGYYLRRK